MSEFVIASPVPTAGVAPGVFRRAVTLQWPGAVFVEPPGEAGIVETAWIALTSDRWEHLVLDLHEAGAAVSVDARTVAAVADAASWWRAAVDVELAPDLWLFDPAGESCRALPVGVRPEQIMALPNVR